MNDTKIMYGSKHEWVSPTPVVQLYESNGNKFAFLHANAQDVTPFLKQFIVAVWGKKGLRPINGYCNSTWEEYEIQYNDDGNGAVRPWR